MSAVVLTVFILAANVFGAAMAMPQAVRLARSRVCDGVSAVWVGISVAMNGWWLGYGLAETLWGLVPVSAVGATTYLVIATLLVRLRGVRTFGELAVGVVLGLMPLPALILGGWPAAGVAIGVGYGLQLLPAVVGAYRTRALAGVSPGTWIMAWAESAIWLVYGVVVVDPALLVGGAFGVILPSFLLARLVLTGHQPFARWPGVTRLAWPSG